MGKRVTPDQKRKFTQRLKDGWTITDAAEYASVSYAWAKAHAKGLPNSSGREYARQDTFDDLPGPVPLDKLCPEATEALNDVAVFGAMYFGVIVMPWQTEATTIITELMDTDEEEYVVINCPPGSGKSTFFTKIVPAWLTCKRRHIRGTIGSASVGMAKQYVGELRDILDQPIPLTQSPEAIRAGIAMDPTRCLVSDFGIFKPDGKKWASDAFFVAQPDNISKKEPTWQAFGRGTIFIGTRSDFAIWDDPCDPEGTRTEDSRTAYFNWWDTYAEKRLEPGGLMVVQMQRLDPSDISNHCLGKKAIVFDAQGEVTAESVPKYRHIVFKAHYDDRCQGAVNHGRSAPAYPEGCLLFPRRLPWTKLATERENNPEGYELVYQQEETSPGTVLVDKLWIRGGLGPDGVEYPGCWDEDRGLCELPEGLSRPVISIVSADPSPTKYWAISWWAYHPDTHQHFLLDLQRRTMRASDFLDYDMATGRFVGLMEEWQRRSEELGIPVTHWIVESNAAARFLRQYSFFQTWVAKNRVSLIPHETHRNKSDPKFGVQMLGPLYRQGLVRLPGKQHNAGRTAATKLVSEVTRYRLDGRPSGTTDCLMSQWFETFCLPGILRNVAAQQSNGTLWTPPSWVKAS